jgi:hypothetical protein
VRCINNVLRYSGPAALENSSGNFKVTAWEQRHAGGRLTEEVDTWAGVDAFSRLVAQFSEI